MAYQFQLVAGHPALEFLNTVQDWTVANPRDYLTDFSDALRFGQVAGLLTPAEVRRLGRRSGGVELRRLRRARARLERVFRAVVRSRRPDRADLDALARDAARAARAMSFRRSAGLLGRRVNVRKAGVATLRWRVVDAAVTLLTSQQSVRVKACPSCGWFMLDGTRNNSRRWCSMATCGSAAKSRRYYWRTKRRSRPRPAVRLRLR